MSYQKIVVYTLIGTLSGETGAAVVDSCGWDTKCRNGTPSQQDRHPHGAENTTSVSSGHALMWGGYTQVGSSTAFNLGTVALQVKATASIQGTVSVST